MTVLESSSSVFSPSTVFAFSSISVARFASFSASVVFKSSISCLCSSFSRCRFSSFSPINVFMSSSASACCARYAANSSATVSFAARSCTSSAFISFSRFSSSSSRHCFSSSRFSRYSATSSSSAVLIAFFSMFSTNTSLFSLSFSFRSVSTSPFIFRPCSSSPSKSFTPSSSHRFANKSSTRLSRRFKSPWSSSRSLSTSITDSPKACCFSSFRFWLSSCRESVWFILCANSVTTACTWSSKLCSRFWMPNIRSASCFMRSVFSSAIRSCIVCVRLSFSSSMRASSSSFVSNTSVLQSSNTLRSVSSIRMRSSCVTSAKPSQRLERSFSARSIFWKRSVVTRARFCAASSASR
mmetsp:Transcript_1508/g.3531  ORF Transcript_1508/g.3531 Transcript_1508/m.3531 type:complete len:354 (+) Transcript_1508:580-1641(+)